MKYNVGDKITIQMTGIVMTKEQIEEVSDSVNDNKYDLFIQAIRPDGSYGEYWELDERELEVVDVIETSPEENIQVGDVIKHKIIEENIGYFVSEVKEDRITVVWKYSEDDDTFFKDYLFKSELCYYKKVKVKEQ